MQYATLITQHHDYNCNCACKYTNCTTLQLQLHYTTLQLQLQLQLQLHYTTLHPAVVVRWPLQPLQPFQKTQLQPPVGPSVDSLCHPWFTTTNLSYRFPMCGTTGISDRWTIIHYPILDIYCVDCVDYSICFYHIRSYIIYYRPLSMNHVHQQLTICYSYYRMWYMLVNKPSMKYQHETTLRTNMHITFCETWDGCFCTSQSTSRVLSESVESVSFWLCWSEVFLIWASCVGESTKRTTCPSF